MAAKGMDLHGDIFCRGRCGRRVRAGPTRTGRKFAVYRLSHSPSLPHAVGYERKMVVDSILWFARNLHQCANDYSQHARAVVGR